MLKSFWKWESSEGGIDWGKADAWAFGYTDIDFELKMLQVPGAVGSSQEQDWG